MTAHYAITVRFTCQSCGLEKEADIQSNEEPPECCVKCRLDERRAMTLVEMFVVDVPEGGALRPRLLELSHGHEFGQMVWRFGDHQEGDWIVMARVGETIVGWALVFKCYGRMNLHVFVDPEHRKVGVGKALIRAALERERPLYVTAQTEAARRLFSRPGLVVADERVV